MIHYTYIQCIDVYAPLSQRLMQVLMRASFIRLLLVFGWRIHRPLSRRVMSAWLSTFTRWRWPRKVPWLDITFQLVLLAWGLLHCPLPHCPPLPHGAVLSTPVLSTPANSAFPKLIERKVATESQEYGYREKNDTGINIVQRIIERKLNFFGHVCRMQDDRLLKQAVFGIMDSKNKWGRPKRRWTNDLVDWCNKVICSLYGLAIGMKEMEPFREICQSNGHWAHGTRERDRATIIYRYCCVRVLHVDVTDGSYTGRASRDRAGPNRLRSSFVVQISDIEECRWP